MKKILLALILIMLSQSLYANTNDTETVERPAPGVFPDAGNGFMFDFHGVPRHGKYPGDWIDIGAFEYVPDELKDANGKYIQGSYIKEDGTVYIPNLDAPRKPVGVKRLALLKKRG